MAKRYLVTGGTGFIGSAIVRCLVHSGCQVVCYDNDSRGSSYRLNDVADDVQFVDADIRDKEALIQAAKGVDSLVHLAFVNGTEFFYDKPKLVLDVGVRGMINVLDVCAAVGIPELVLASSSEVYQTPPMVPTDESAPLSIPDVMNPRYSYAGGKLISELMAINYGRDRFGRVLIFRPHNVYGPDMGWEHVLPQFVTRLAKSVSESVSSPVMFEMQGDGTQTRAFIHIDDFVSGVMTILSRGKHLNIYHIGTMEEITIEYAAREIARLFGVEIEIRQLSVAQGGALRRCPDISKLKSLGFTPKISFKEGIPSLVDWYRNNIQSNPKMEK